MVDKAIADNRLGKRGLGMLLLPQGVLFGSLQASRALRAVFSDDFANYDSINGFFVWLLMLVSAILFLGIVAFAIICFFRTRCVVRRIRVEQEKVEFVTFWGGKHELFRNELLSIEPVKPNPIILFDLLSKKVENWRMTTKNGGEYFLNGEIFREDNFVVELRRARG